MLLLPTTTLGSSEKGEMLRVMRMRGKQKRKRGRCMKKLSTKWEGRKEGKRIDG